MYILSNEREIVYWIIPLEKIGESIERLLEVEFISGKDISAIPCNNESEIKLRIKTKSSQEANDLTRLF
ncbi:MAG: hypothetical protein ABIH48_00770 [Candidatus Falkowbacteria bacterium]